MEEEILRALEKAEEMQWITISPHLQRTALAALIVEIAFKQMSLRRAIEIFVPKELW